MATDVTIPAVGESITEGTLSRWLVENGSYIEEDAPLFELETDKISTEVGAPTSGVVTFSAEEGATLEIGAVVAVIDESAAKPEGGAAPAADSTPAAAPAPAPASAPAGESHDHLSPAVAKLIAENNLDPKAISGTGKDGRLTKGDVLAAIEAKAKAPAPVAKPAPAAKPAAASSVPLTDGETRTRMTSLRKRIAARLVSAQRTAAILTTFNEVDMSAAMALRKKYKEEFAETHETGLGFMSFFTTAAVRALQKYPLINARIDGDDVVANEHIQMGIAVGTDRGLVVPVLREAEKMSFADIEKGIRSYAKKARDGGLTIADMEGGTFTITNGGVYGSLMSTPIINPPQSGILGMHAIKERPMAVDGQVVIRPMMYIALSYDHRIVDGAEAVGFLVRIKELIENPDRLILGL